MNVIEQNQTEFPSLIAELSERSVTPTNNPDQNNEVDEFSIDLDVILGSLDPVTESNADNGLSENQDILNDYIKELSPYDSDEMAEESNSLSFGSSILSNTSTEGNASSYFEDSYNALSFVEHCSQEIFNINIDSENKDEFYNESPPHHLLRRDSPISTYSPIMMFPTGQVVIPLGTMSLLGKDILCEQGGKTVDSIAIRLKSSLSEVRCFDSDTLKIGKNDIFDFSTLSPDDIIRQSRNDLFADRMGSKEAVDSKTHLKKKQCDLK